MALIAQALVTADEADAYLQNQNADHDDVIEQIINGVSQEFSTFSGISFVSATYTAVPFTGDGTSTLSLPVWPVTTLTSVVEDGATLTVDVDFSIDMDRGVLSKLKLNWPWYDQQPIWSTQVNGIVVTWVGGYAFASLPADIKLAALKEIGRQYKLFLTKGDGEVSRAISGSSVSYATSEPEWKATMNRYRRIHI